MTHLVLERLHLSGANEHDDAGDEADRGDQTDQRCERDAGENDGQHPARDGDNAERHRPTPRYVVAALLNGDVCTQDAGADQPPRRPEDGEGEWREELLIPPRPHYVAWLFTVVAIWLFAGSTHYARLFDVPPEIVVLYATLLALIWTAYHTYRGVEHARMLVKREDTAAVTARTSICTALYVEIVNLNDALTIVTRDLVTADEAGEFLPRPQIRIALSRSDLLAPGVASQIVGLEGRLSRIEANIRMRERLKTGLDRLILSTGKELKIKEEIEVVSKRLLETAEQARADLSRLEIDLAHEIGRDEPPGATTRKVLMHWDADLGVIEDASGKKY